MTKQMSRNEALERIKLGIRQSCSEANGSNIGECNECWRFPCNDMKALLVLRDLTEEERPQGEWEWQTEDKYRCTNCGEVVRVKEVMHVPQYNFCPMCGADIRKSLASYE